MVLNSNCLCMQCHAVDLNVALSCSRPKDDSTTWPKALSHDVTICCTLLCIVLYITLCCEWNVQVICKTNTLFSDYYAVINLPNQQIDPTVSSVHVYIRVLTDFCHRVFFQNSNLYRTATLSKEVQKGEGWGHKAILTTQWKWASHRHHAGFRFMSNGLASGSHASRECITADPAN